MNPEKVAKPTRYRADTVFGPLFASRLSMLLPRLGRIGGSIRLYDQGVEVIAGQAQDILAWAEEREVAS